MPKTINKVYWIVHPARAIAARPGFTRLTPEQTKAFIRKKINPILEQARKEQDALVVFVKTPAEMYLRGGRVPGVTDAGVDQIVQIENDLERDIRHKMQARAIIPEEGLSMEAPEIVADLIRRKGFEVSKKAYVEGRGVWREVCPRRFPANFRSHLGIKGRFVVPKSGTLALEKRRRI